MISPEQVEYFLNGYNPLKYVVAIESNAYSNKADVIIHNPETNEKKIEKIKFTPFLWFQYNKNQSKKLFDGDKHARKQAMEKYGIKYKDLKISDEEGDIERLENGYKYLFYTESGTYDNILNFFKSGGFDIRKMGDDYKNATIKHKIIETELEEVENKIEILERKLKRETIKYDNLNDNDNDELRKEIINKLNEGKLKGKITEKAYSKRKNELIERIDNINKELVIKKEKIKELIILEEGSNRKLQELKPCVLELNTNEQFMISTGIRLFKGFDNYNDLEKLTFDIETTGLNPETDRIFLIGCKTNKGFKTILAPKKENDDKAEAEMILNFFHLYTTKIKPAIIFGFNSENFDWYFLLHRAEKLGIYNKDAVKIQTTLSTEKHYKNNDLYRYKINLSKDSLKVGSESEFFIRKSIYGINNIDIWHAVRRAKAINSDIKETGLKYIAKFAEVAKENRTYIPHEKIYRYWFENKNFIINKENSDYLVIPDEYQSEPLVYLKEYNLTNNVNYELTNGQELVTNYLIDDLDETEAVDIVYNEKNFMLAKNIPTSFTKVATCGDASLWNLLMCTWSFENNIAIPYITERKKFVGGLSRTYVLGKSNNILKADFAGLYPSIQIAHEVFPRHDIFQILKALLIYFRETRNKYKSLAKKEIDIKKQEFYNSKQLPLKILNNAMYGSFGSEYFNWSDFDKAEEVTCRGRLYLRKMVRFFMDKGMQPVILDTDGVSLSIPDHYEIKFIIDKKENDQTSKIYFHSYKEAKNYIETIIQSDKNIKWKKKKGDVYESENITLKLYEDDSAIQKLFDEFNNGVLENEVKLINKGIMKVDNDGRWESCITVGRKNYANLEFNGKIKLVGNSIKSTTLPDFIEEFLNKALTMLLKGKGKEFIEYYYSYIADIYNKEIPLKKIASKKRIKMTNDEYLKRGVDKTGRLKAKQVHMELLIQNNMDLDLGTTVYIVNNGTKKQDVDSSINKLTNQFNAYLISSEDLEKNPNKKGDYNVAKYIDDFNTRIEGLLVCFKQDVAKKLLVSNPEDRVFFTDEECEITSFNYDNYPYDKDDLDSIEELFVLEDREVHFWNRIVKNPCDIFKEFKTSENTKLNIKYIEKFDYIKSKIETTKYKLKSDKESLKNLDFYLEQKDDNFLLFRKKDESLQLLREL